MAVQLVIAGNFRLLTRKVLPTGEKQRTTYKKSHCKDDIKTGQEIPLISIGKYPRYSLHLSSSTSNVMQMRRCRLLICYVHTAKDRQIIHGESIKPHIFLFCKYFCVGIDTLFSFYFLFWI